MYDWVTQLFKVKIIQTNGTRTHTKRKKDEAEAYGTRYASADKREKAKISIWSLTYETTGNRRKRSRTASR